MQRKYQMPLGALARLLLWSNGELGTSPDVEVQMKHLSRLLRAKLAAIETQLIETAAARKALEGRPDGGASEDPAEQAKLPWED